MDNLKEYMLIFRMQNSSQKPSETEQKIMHEQWGKFIGSISGQSKLVSTTRLGFEGAVIDSNLNKTNSIYSSDEITVSGNMILKASSLQEASALAEACLILNIGGSVEIRSILPM